MKEEEPTTKRAQGRVLQAEKMASAKAKAGLGGIGEGSGWVECGEPSGRCDWSHTGTCRPW